MLVVGVKFKQSGKTYFFDPEELSLKEGDKVIVKSNKGLEIGKVVLVDKQIDENSFNNQINPVIRLASDDDLRKDYLNKIDAKEAIKVCQEKADKLNLKMKVVDGEFTFDRSKLILSFLANKRIDFRTLVKELAIIYKNRIELRQIGVRDHAKILDCHGICGCKCCCSRFLNDFSPLSVKMAKEQNITLDPAKISGICGRLMCCISYEYDSYKEIKKIMPKQGQKVETVDGQGVVMENNYVNEHCKVRVHLEEDDEDIEKYYCYKDLEILN
ncbi:MAG: regulatory iron-sulfur-containing complex subunit RicT [Peptoniphilaceae bacterium]|nr:regulatory iron-sulfur-containing complex subunit RicT [Peptoniphilaceae bacterium]MDY6019121.1 regulatory iron-sulfur-containing complex subunit RicT [Anaerococcus sp.]